jgi:hypothetical protein
LIRKAGGESVGDLQYAALDGQGTAKGGHCCFCWGKQRFCGGGRFTTGYGRDGTPAHAMERIFGALAASRGEMRWR